MFSLKNRFISIIIIGLFFSLTAKTYILLNKPTNNKIYNFNFVNESKAAEPIISENEELKEISPKNNEKELNNSEKTTNFTDIELEMLKTLSLRREELDKREQNIINKQNLLKATEKIIDERFSELTNLKKEVISLLEAYDRKEDEKITSLVRIYENMKPRDAAIIFEELDMKVLLQVINKMKEAKSAPIIAQMSPEKARKITIEYAKQKKLSLP